MGRILLSKSFTPTCTPVQRVRRYVGMSVCSYNGHACARRMLTGSRGDATKHLPRMHGLPENSATL